jgi:IclR family acetate operon transcriptional repressor
MKTTTSGTEKALTRAVTTPAPESAAARIFSVLELLAVEREPVRLSTIASKLDLQKSTAHRALTTLMTLGYVEQLASTKHYKATLRLWELGCGLAAHHSVKRAATPVLHELHQATRETISLSILSGDDVLYLDKLVSPRSIRFTSRVGTRAPAPLTAGGKAILAYEPEARAIIRRAQKRIDASFRVSTELLLRELHDIRSNGYSTSSFRPGVVSFGAPIIGVDGRAIAAISISAPTNRLTATRRDQIIEQLLAACGEIGEQVEPFVGSSVHP